MTLPHSQAEIIAHNQGALAELERAISLRPQRFSLILAHCNYDRLRSQLVQHLQETVTLAVAALSPQIRHLRQALEQALPPVGPQLCWSPAWKRSSPPSPYCRRPTWVAMNSLKP